MKTIHSELADKLGDIISGCGQVARLVQNRLHDFLRWQASVLTINGTGALLFGHGIIGHRQFVVLADLLLGALVKARSILLGRNACIVDATFRSAVLIGITYGHVLHFPIGTFALRRAALFQLFSQLPLVQGVLEFTALFIFT